VSPNQYTPKSRRAEPTVVKPIRWPVSEWKEVQRGAKAARLTESEYIRRATLEAARQPHDQPRGE